jgi:transketolase
LRTAFIESLCELAAEDERVWLLSGDLGYSVLERFIQKFPDRFVNVGVAEQNMMGIAAGLAMSGNIVFTYSIANFPVMRCLEQIRNDICYHNLNVKIVAVGGGLAYGPAGYTHHALEDLAVMRAMPGMIVLAPGDPVEARLAIRAIAEHEGPCYLRLGKAGEPVVHHTQPQFRIGEAISLRDGRDVTLISTGGMLKRSLDAAYALAAHGLEARVLSMHTVKPLDVKALSDAASTTRLLVTLEEHGEVGGLADAVARCLVERAIKCAFISFTISGERALVGSQSYLLEQAGLSTERIAARIEELLMRKPGTLEL